MKKLEKATVRVELRVWLPLLWLFLLLLAAFLLPDRVWNTLLIGFGGLFAIAYVWAKQLARELHGERRLRFGWVAVGDQLEEQFTLHNEGALPALWVEVLDNAKVPGYQAAVVQSVGGNQTVRWRQTAVCQQRGQFTLGPWTLRSGDPFGIFIVTHHYPISSEIIIHPPIHSQLPIALPAGQSSGQARMRRQAWQATINASTVRSYQPQDPLRWIHWPTSAHREALYVRQFDQDAAGDIWLLLDVQTAVQLGSGADSSEEHAILLAAALVARAIGQNRAIGLASYGQPPQIIAPGSGQGQQWKLLRALALSQANGTLPLLQAMGDLAHIAQQGAAAIIITASNTLDWLPQLLTLARSGIESTLVLLDRPSFGGQGNSAEIQTAVHRLGFQAQIVRRGDLGQPPQPEQPRGFWEFRTTPSGGTIVVRSPLTDHAA